MEIKLKIVDFELNMTADTAAVPNSNPYVYNLWYNRDSISWVKIMLKGG